MIPKKIHYCWFGGNPLSELAQKCIESWKKYCPDYEIIEWNEQNFDINYSKYVKEAYNAKKWAFVSDYVRLYVLYNHGGIYMDTDVEVIKNMDDFLGADGFSGFESKYTIPTGIIASNKGNLWVKEQLDSYEDDNFLDKEGNPILVTNVERITKISRENHNFIPNGKLQKLKYGMMIYPKEYFCPKSLDTGKIDLTQNSYTIHHFDGSWLPEVDRLTSNLYWKYNKILPNHLAGLCAKFVAISRIDGFCVAVKEMMKWIVNKG